MRITPQSSAAEALRWMEATGSDAAVVIDERGPVGVVTRDAIAGADGPLVSPDAAVVDVMDYEVVRLDPGTGTRGTLKAYTRAGWRSAMARRPYADDTMARREASRRNAHAA
jgi:hypothetical protein